MSKGMRGIREAMRAAVMGFQPSDSLIEKLIGGRFGSSEGVAEVGYMSVTDFLKGPVTDLAEFINMAWRVVACFRQAMGNVAADYTSILFTSLQYDMVPQGSATSPRLGLTGAIDVANNALYRVSNGVLVADLTGIERWRPVILNVKNSERFADVLVVQNVANIKEMIQAGANDSKRKRQQQKDNGQQQQQQQQQPKQQQQQKPKQPQGGQGPKGARPKKPQATIVP
jgi:hypothetical protein